MHSFELVLASEYPGDRRASRRARKALKLLRAQKAASPNLPITLGLNATRSVYFSMRWLVLLALMPQIGGLLLMVGRSAK